MTGYQGLVFIHVALLVFWVGTDVGVFLLTRRAQSDRASVAVRVALLSAAAQLDCVPRLCFVLMIAVGATLTAMGGWAPLDARWLPAIWIADLVWLAAVLIGYVRHNGGRSLWFWVERGFEAVLLVGLASAGVLVLARGEGAGVPAWLGWKLVAYAAICLWALLLARLGGRSAALFARLEREGGSAELQRAIDRALPPVLGVVLLIYATALAAAFMGVTKWPA